MNRGATTPKRMVSRPGDGASMQDRKCIMRVAAITAVCCLGVAAAAAAQDAKVARGQQASFTDQKCTLCHSYWRLIGQQERGRSTVFVREQSCRQNDILSWNHRMRRG
jgi:hypothetical protein